MNAVIMQSIVKHKTTFYRQRYINHDYTLNKTSQIHKISQCLKKEEEERNNTEKTSAACSVSVLSLSSLPAIRAKRRMFFINVFGVTSNHDYTIVKVTQDTTTQEVIQQALQKANKSDARPDDYVLMEEVHKGWEKKEKDAGSQRILDLNEKVLLAQNKWKGSGKFMLRRKCEDPSTRAWMTTMVQEQKRRTNSSVSDIGPEWDSAQKTFLVCIFNLAPDQPYTILEAPTSSTVQDVITQAMLKARRQDNPSNFVLLEESLAASVSTDVGGGGGAAALARSAFRSGGTRHTTRRRQRVLADDDNVYAVQSGWKSEAGKLILTARSQIPACLAAAGAGGMVGTSAAAGSHVQQQEIKEKPKKKSGIQRWSFMRFSSLSREQKDREKNEAIVDEDHHGMLHANSSSSSSLPSLHHNNGKQRQQHKQQKQRPKHFPTLRSLDEVTTTTATTSDDIHHHHHHHGNNNMAAANSSSSSSSSSSSANNNHHHHHHHHNHHRLHNQSCSDPGPAPGSFEKVVTPKKSPRRRQIIPVSQ